MLYLSLQHKSLLSTVYVIIVLMSGGRAGQDFTKMQNYYNMQ
jgi:hypothetical protein